jgi:two-component system LytT family response regulator
MNTLRAIIIDDEQKGINSLKLLLEKFISEVNVVAETTDPNLGIVMIEDFNPDIVFLDIKMPHLDGFDLLERLKNREFSLIFTTAYEQYAIKAIRRDAVDYLLKPVDIEDLKAAIVKVKEERDRKTTLPDLSGFLEILRNNDSSKILFHTREKVEYISKSNIIRLESDSNYTHVHLTNGSKLTMSRTIGDYELQLCDQDKKFMRIHQSHIVNLTHIVRYMKDNGGYIIMNDNSNLPLSKNKKEEFLKWLDLK